MELRFRSMASGIIYLIILVMWGAYFIPRLIHRHEESSPKAGDRYKNAIRSVSQAQTSRASFSPEFMDPMQKSKIIAQRRTIFSGLTFLLIASGVAASLGMMAWSILAIPGSGFAIFIVAVRRQIVSAKLKAQRLNTLQKIMTAEIKIDPEARISLRADALSTEHWIPLADREDPSGVVVIPKDRTGWSPISVPRPTYSTAAKAITPKRVIDLTVPGQWSAEQEILNQLNLPGVTKRETLFDQTLLEEAAEPHVDSEAI
jgi:hypothetical protein